MHNARSKNSLRQNTLASLKYQIMNTERNLLWNVLMPPMAVARKNNSNLSDRQVQLACLLTLFFWIPGIVYSLVVCYGTDTQSPFQVTISQPQPLHTIPKFLFSYPTSPTTIVISTPIEAEASPVNPFKATDVIV